MDNDAYLGKDEREGQERQQKTYDDFQKSLAFDIKRDVFDDNSRGYNLVFGTLTGGRNTRGINVRKRWRTSARGKIRIIRGRKRAIVRKSRAAIEPLL